MSTFTWPGRLIFPIIILNCTHIPFKFNFTKDFNSVLAGRLSILQNRQKFYHQEHPRLNHII